MQNATRIIDQFNQLKSQRQAHESVWRECFDYTYPLRGSGFESDMTLNDANRKNASKLDATATDSVRILASMIMSGLTPANSRWFGLDVGTESDDEQRWLDAVAQTIWENIHMSNFDSEAFECCVDVAVAGWFALYIEEDKKNGGYRFEQWPLASVYASSSTATGKVDTVFRRFRLTAQQIINEFGEQAASESVRKLIADNKPGEKVELIHAIFPRDGGSLDAKISRGMPFASLTIEVQAKKLLRESGYREMPVAMPRWMLIPSTAYGVGPVFDALPDIKMINEINRHKLAAAELAVAGMWIAEDDGVLNPRTVTVGARKIITAASVDSMRELKSGSDFNVAYQEAELLQRNIRKLLMADQLQPQDGPAMTATEVHARVNMVRQQLGPVYGRLQAEYLQVLIERCFGIAYRAGVLNEPPESLAGREFTVKYLSPMAKAQKLEDVGSIERWLGTLSQLAQIKPEILDIPDVDEVGRTLAKSLGVPADALKSEGDVDAAREQQAEAAEQAQQQQAEAAVMQQAMANR